MNVRIDRLADKFGNSVEPKIGRRDASGYTKERLRNLRPEVIFDKPFRTAEVAAELCRLLAPSGGHEPRGSG